MSILIVRALADERTTPYTVYRTYEHIIIYLLPIDVHVDRFRVVRVSIIIIIIVVVGPASVFFLTRFIIIFYIPARRELKYYIYV